MANTSSSLDSLKSGSLSLLSSAESTVTKTLSVFSNNYLSTVCLVLLVAYAPIAAPTLGPSGVNEAMNPFLQASEGSGAGDTR